MAKVQAGRFAARRDSDVVVFIIGMRINRLHRPDKWIPVAKEMGPMVRELMTHPEKGLLHAETFLSGRKIGLVQYWNSYEQLERFARDRDDLHLPAWRRFNTRIGTDGSVGIYHETYVVSPGRFETIYANVPPMGLAKATEHVPVSALGQASRFRMTHQGADQPAEPVPT